MEDARMTMLKNVSQMEHVQLKPNTALGFKKEVIKMGIVVKISNGVQEEGIVSH